MLIIYVRRNLKMRFWVLAPSRPRRVTGRRLGRHSSTWPSWLGYELIVFSDGCEIYVQELLSDLPASRASLESNNHFELLHAFNCHSPVKHNFAQLSVALQSISSTSYPRATSQPVGLLSVAQNILKANSCTAAEKEKLVGCNT